MWRFLTHGMRLLTAPQMGGLHPRASLFEKPVNLDAAKQAHAEFRRVMREKGVRVLTVRGDAPLHARLPRMPIASPRFPRRMQ